MAEAIAGWVEARDGGQELSGIFWRWSAENTGGWGVRVSTDRGRCTSWDEASARAVEHMREADAKRRGG